MKLVTFRDPGDHRSPGIAGLFTDEGIIDLTRAVPEFNAEHPGQVPLGATSVLDLLNHWDRSAAGLSAIERWIGTQKGRIAPRPVESVELMAPLPRPTSMRDGY